MPNILKHLFCKSRPGDCFCNGDNLSHKILPLTFVFSFCFKYFQSKHLLLFSQSPRQPVWLNWFIADKASDTLKIFQEIRSNRTAVFCKNDLLLNFTIKKSICDGVPFGKAVNLHVFNWTKTDAFTGVFLKMDFVNTIFFWFFSFKHPFGYVLQNSSS